MAGPGAVNLFVYGTLRRSAAHPMHALLRETASSLGDARVRGVLYRVAAYPGLVLDAEAGWVQGELYRLRDPGVLERLDAYEGVGPLDPEPREYRRIRATVQCLDGEEHEAWVYEYGWDPAGLEIIASGDFLRPDR
jgi:gamma-glutamylcyclotransferase (GGCT)/AIG2-like uncharacterized protein YtfP